MNVATYHECLPDIDLAVAETPLSVIMQISELAIANGNYEVENHFDVMGEKGFHIVNFRRSSFSAHEGLGGQLISRLDKPNRVLIEMRAERWNPNPPTREIYCEAARSIFKPLITAYNRVNGARLRMRIENLKSIKKPLSPGTQKLFDRFVLLANKRSLHPRDWEYFYDFIAASRKQQDEWEVRSLLLAAGFSEQTADRLSDIYYHLCKFKRYRR